MVKPPKTMQPESVNLVKAGRDVQRAFQEDSFHNYMARKIDMQRQQFGLLIPPDPLLMLDDDADNGARVEDHPRNLSHETTAPDKPQTPAPSNKKTIRFALPEATTTISPKDSMRSMLHRSRSAKKFGVMSVLQRLQRRHGTTRSQKTKKRRLALPPQQSDDDDTTTTTNPSHTAFSPSPQNTLPPGCHSIVTDDADPCSNASPEPSIAAPGSNVVMELQSSSSILPHNKQHRADLFLMGVVIMVNGYTEPDSETLQRMLHKHGGDLERYETSRITHILADRLSTAKATMHKRQKRSTARPVCKPKWIVDCVAQGKLLPWTDYLLSDVKDDAGTRSAACFFRKDGPSECVIDNPNQDALDDKCTPLEDDTEVVLPQPETSVGPEKPVATGNIASRTGVEHTNASPTNHRGALGNKVRTVGNDPQFLESFFAASRLSFIGSYKQRAKSSSGGGKHSPQSSTFNSKRYIFHVDMDCFFASVALRKFPEYQGKPVAISHLGEKFGKPENPQVLRVASDSTSECATCNYEARKFGIRKGMFLGQAKKLCPDLIVLQYDFEGYEEVSDAVTGILERYAAENDGVVEQVSCDESYAEFYLAEHEGVTSMTFAFELAECIRNEIFDLTQCTASVGVGRNKLLAKLATDHVKPNKSFVVDDDGRSLLRSIQLRELHGVGYRMERKLQEEELVTVSDVLDLGNQGETELSRILGPTLGKKLFGFCHGDDDRPIHPPERKTIGAECNYGVRFDGPYGVDYMIEGLCREVEKRMTAVGVKGTKVTLKVKQRKDGAPPPPKFLGHGKCNNLSKCKDVPVGTYATRDWACFYELAAIMFAEMKVLKDDVRGMGITVCKLVKDGTSESGGKSSKSSISSWFAGKAPDACVSDVQDNGERPDSPEGVNTDEDSVVVLSQVNEVRIPRYQSDFEIALPAFSQIRMSQVEELPLDMRHLILSKMEKERQSRSVPVCTTSFAENIPQDARYRQTDVKRMFRLASMKTGNYRVGDNDISLTQLDQLPLEMQLQVANDDLQRMGTLSPQKKIQKPSTTLCSNRTRHDKNVSIPRGSIDAIVLRNEEEGLEVVTYPELAADSTNTQFFTDNVLPLSIFMDENSDANAEAIDQVVQYLQLCVTENRLQDVVVLLRSIWHRKDRWKTISFDSIFTAVNEKFDQITGSRLDRDWVVR